MLILRVVKVLCFHTVLQVFILKGVSEGTKLVLLEVGDASDSVV